MSDAIIGALGAFSALMMALTWQLRRRNNQQNSQHSNPGNPTSLFDYQRFMGREDIAAMERRLLASLDKIQESLQRIEVKLH